MRRNPAWFPVIDMAEWEEWLTSSDSLVVNRTVWALGLMAATWPEETVALIRGLPEGAARDNSVRFFLRLADVHRGRHWRS
jgi:hypothetical protein